MNGQIKSLRSANVETRKLATVVLISRSARREGDAPPELGHIKGNVSPVAADTGEASIDSDIFVLRLL